MCRYVCAANLLGQFLVVLSFNFMRNQFTNVLPDSSQLVKLVFTGYLQPPKGKTASLNASRNKCFYAYCMLGPSSAQIQVVVSVLHKHVYIYSAFSKPSETSSLATIRTSCSSVLLSHSHQKSLGDIHLSRWRKSRKDPKLLMMTEITLSEVFVGSCSGLVFPFYSSSF